MTNEQWQQFYPNRGKLIKQSLIAYMPVLEAYAKISPRMLHDQLQSIYNLATKQAKMALVIANPGLNFVGSDNAGPAKTSDEAPQ